MYPDRECAQIFNQTFIVLAQTFVASGGFQLLQRGTENQPKTSANVKPASQYPSMCFRALGGRGRTYVQTLSMAVLWRYGSSVTATTALLREKQNKKQAENRPEKQAVDAKAGYELLLQTAEKCSRFSKTRFASRTPEPLQKRRRKHDEKQLKNSNVKHPNVSN